MKRISGRHRFGRYATRSFGRLFLAQGKSHIQNGVICACRSIMKPGKPISTTMKA
nr:MAG TPA: hypothetical protein [Caudoviricetes sp.]